MKRMAAIFMALLFSAGLSFAQTPDPFAGIRKNLMDAASASVAAVYERRFEVVPQVRPAVIRRYSGTAFRRLNELKPVIGPIFEQHSVPQEFLLVAMIESGFRTEAVSAANAIGMWQFIESTARRFGLIDSAGDHRTDLVRSTHAAAQYLDFLLSRYKDWPLVLAAYNAGEERVDRAIAEAESRDFAELARRRLLPDETLKYVPAVLRSMARARSAEVFP